jgi:hypothetical protein
MTIHQLPIKWSPAEDNVDEPAHSLVLSEPTLQTPVDLTKYREEIAAVESAWEAASELRSVLHAASTPVRDWFAKRLTHGEA